MSKSLRARMWARGGLAGLLAAAVLAVVPVAPASAIQTIAWTTAPPATSTVGNQISFAWSGTANTFLGARITGCFANFPEGNNYTRSFGGNFTTGNCNIVNRVIPLAGTYPIAVGFTLSTGGQMTMTWNVTVSAPTPTVYISPPSSPVVATTAHGYPMPSVSAYGSDAVYGSYAAGCTPAVGTVLPVGTNTITCSATNGAGKTGTSTTSITVTKGTPTVSWSVPSSVNFGTTYGQLMTATMSPADAAGTISYTRAGGAAVAPSDVIPVGANQAITATYVPSGQVSAYNSVTATKTVSVLQTAQTVAFAAGTPTNASYGDSPLTVSAAGTSNGGNVTIEVQPGSTCVSSQNNTGTTVTATVTPFGGGQCVLLANQAATGNWTAAPTAQWSINVLKVNTVVSWPASSTLTYGATLAGVLNASATSNIGGVPGTFAYTLGGTPVSAGTVPNATTGATLTATFTPANTGAYTSASQSRTLVVAKANPGLTLSVPADSVYGAAPYQASATSLSPAALTWQGLTPLVCSISSSGVVVTHRSGTCEFQVTQAAAQNYNASSKHAGFVVAKATAGITWATPSDIAYGTALGTDQLDAVVDGADDLDGTTAYTLADGTAADGNVLPVGDHVLTATWTPTNSAAWNSASTSVTLRVDRAVPDLSWPTPADIVHGTPLGGDQLNAVSNQPGTFTYTVDGGSAAAGGQVLEVGDHTLLVTFVPDDTDNFLTAASVVPITVTPQPDTADTLGPEAQHQVDEQRVEAQADLSAGETRTFSVTCPSGYFASDGSGRVDAVDQGTGTLADVVVRESRSTSPDTWTVTMANHATGRAQGKVFADCVQRETAEVDGHRHALVLDQAATETRDLTGPTTVTVACADDQYPVAPGFQLDGDAVVRRSAADGTSAWTFEVVPSGATTGTFSARCLDDRVSRVSGHDHRLDLRQVAAHVTVGAGQVVEAQTTCGDLARGIVGGWSLEGGLLLTGAEPRAKTRATRLFNPTSGPLSADLTLQCLETRTAGGSSSTDPAAPAAPSVAPQAVVPASTLSLKPQGSVAAPSSRGVTVTARGRAAANVSCASGETTCTGTVQLVALRTQRVAGKLLRKGTVLGTAAFSVAAGSVDRVVLRTTRRGQRVLPAAGLRKAQLRVGDQVRTVSLRR